MSARDEVLDRVRRALVGAQPPAPVQRDYRTAGQPYAHASDSLAELLVDRLVDYRAAVRRTSERELTATIAEALAARDVRRMILPAGIPDEWLPGLADVEVVRDEPALSAKELDALDGAITTCAVAIAETGTIVLDGGAGQGRRALTLVPDYHLIVVRLEQVVPGVPEAIATLDPLRPLTWISGPSATSDIELNRVEGVHGPRSLEIVLVG